MTYSMTGANFYLICFAVGFCFSFFSFLFGGPRSGRLHLPHFHGQVGAAHPPSAGLPAAHAPVATGAAGDAAASAHSQQSGGVSPFNFVTLTAFLPWFGGAGYLLTRYSGLWVGVGLLASAASGLVGGGIVFLFLSTVLISEDENMDAADYEMVGVTGPGLQYHPRRWNRRNHLYANGNAAGVRRAQRGPQRDRQGNRSRGHALRKGNCLRAVVERDVWG